MSDRYYGKVTFPGWAVKYIPGLQDDHRLKLLQDSKMVSLAEEEARDGVPWVCDAFNSLGIPYDRSSAEYFECRAETKYSRFRKGGKIEDLVVTDGDDLVQAKDIISIIDKGNNLAAIRRWCQDKLDLIAPLTPPIEDISEAEYLAWVKEKAWVFQNMAQ